MSGNRLDNAFYKAMAVVADVTLKYLVYPITVFVYLFATLNGDNDRNTEACLLFLRLLLLVLCAVTALIVYVFLAIKWLRRPVYDEILRRSAEVGDLISWLSSLIVKLFSLKKKSESRPRNPDQSVALRKSIWLILECYSIWWALSTIVLKSLAHFGYYEDEGILANLTIERIQSAYADMEILKNTTAAANETLSDFIVSTNQKCYAMILLSQIIFTIAMMIASEAIRCWDYWPMSRPEPHFPRTGCSGAIRLQIEGFWGTHSDNSVMEMLLHVCFFNAPILFASPLIISWLSLDTPPHFLCIFIGFVLLPYLIYLIVRVILANLRLFCIEYRDRTRNRARPDAAAPLTAVEQPYN